MSNFNQHGGGREPQWRKRRSQAGGGHGSGNQRNYSDSSGERQGDRDSYRRRGSSEGGYREGGHRKDNRRGGKWQDRRGGNSRNDRNDRRGSYRTDREDNRGGRRNYRDDRGVSHGAGERSGRSSYRRGEKNEAGSRRGFNRGGRRFDRDNRRDNRRDEHREREAQAPRSGKHSFGVRDSRYRAKEWRHDNEPQIPAAVKASDLDRESRAALSSLDPDNAEKVARHLVMAGSLLDVDAEEAYLHAKAAVSRAGRIGTVREACALAAYASGKYSEALREVRAARRLDGTDSLRAIEADCERGLGKPEKALEIISETDTSAYGLSDLVELVIVQAGARHDLGESDAALLVLNQFLEQQQLEEPVLLARILSYKADLLRELGRQEEADQVAEQTPEVPDTVAIVDLEEVLEADNPYVPSDLRGSRKPLVETADVLLIDLDGVCYAGTRDIPNAASGLAAARETGIKFQFVTNNASRNPQQVAEKLQGHQIAAAPEEIMTAAMDAVEILTQKIEPASKVLVVGTQALRDTVAQAGFEVVSKASEQPAAVIQGYGAEVGWVELSEAAYAINAGALFMATNLDATLPTEKGFALGNGSLVAAVEHATGQKPFAGGKPFAGIYRKAASHAGASKPLVVGDRLDTDIAGAVAADMLSFHVLTGVSDAKAVALAYPDRRPSYLGLDLTDLTRAHPGPVHQPTGAWTSGESAAFMVAEDGRVMREDEPVDNGAVLSLEDYRALVAAVWDARDQGVFVHLPDIEVVREVESPDPDLSEEDEPPVAEESASSVDGNTEILDSAPSEDEADVQEEVAEESGEKTPQAQVTSSGPALAAKQAQEVAEVAEAANGDEGVDGEDLQLELLLPGEVDSEQQQ
ncbi:HAD-IIA family hydrolase [Varibaculum cambriense]|uniref:HAD-IIA family hydrolase n=1 Tax=Varibaculum cambriense TaxID=184870 RepID=UPI00290F5E10|nr:HAD-IIA family hydrolase [Varibaculum cambriense]MDU5541638.1 HAD-IIA family hydrolase [Varibaculum cambriense]